MSTIYEVVADPDKFQIIAPNNDDIWLWAMAVLQSNDPFTIVPPVEYQGSRAIPIEHTNRADRDALSVRNVGGGASNEAMKAVFDRYPQLWERSPLKQHREYHLAAGH